MTEDPSASPSSAGDDRLPAPRLPPPAFPRGGERTRRRANPEIREGTLLAEDAGDGALGEALISPDEPLVRSGRTIAEDAFISPDDPIVRTAPPRKPEDYEEVMTRRREAMEKGIEADEAEADVRITGVGDRTDPELDPTLERFGDPAVADLVARVGALADSLRERGEAGLRSTPDMTRFEATLRAYCVGYLAGLRRRD